MSDNTPPRFWTPTPDDPLTDWQDMSYAELVGALGVDLPTDSDASVPSLRRLGTATGQAAAGNDVRLSSLQTSLPTSPSDGQVIDLLVDSTNGVVWRLRYRAASSSAFKWEYIGGAPLFAEVDTSQGTSSASFTDLATVGPSVTLPALPNGGDFLIDYGYTFVAGAANGDSYAAVAINGTPVGTAGAVGAAIEEGGTGWPGGPATPIWRRRVFTAVAGAAVLKLMYRGGSGITTSFLNRHIFVQPVRVG